MKWIKNILIFLFIIYTLFCVVLFFTQEKFIFNPEVLAESHVYRMGEEIEVPLSEELSMNCVLIKQPQSKGVILYYHSNRNCIRFAIYQTRQMLDNGYDIFIPDYRGYGKTEGTIKSQQTFYEDAQKAYDYLKTIYPEDQIIIAGYSLGTAPAIYVAAKNNPKHLALVAPFTSLTDVKNDFIWFVPDFLLRYKFPSKKYMKEVKCPVTIFHGTQDNVINVRFGKELASIKPDLANLILSEGRSHRRIIFDGTIQQFFRKLN